MRLMIKIARTNFSIFKIMFFIYFNH